MGFMKDDEYVLLMESPAVERHYTLKDMQVCVDAGVETVARFQGWYLVNPEPNVWDWSDLDEHLERARIAGLKVLIFAPENVPHWLPEDWYICAAYPPRLGLQVHRRPPPYWSVLSPWHAEAMELLEEYLDVLCARYNSDTVRVIYAFSGSGESFLPPGHRAFFDPAAKRAFRERFGHNFMIGPHQDKVRTGGPKDAATHELCRWVQDTAIETMVRQQSILLAHQPDGDLWVNNHLIFEYWQGMWDSGNCVERMYDAMWGLGAENVYAINFTHYPHGPGWANIVIPLVHRHKVKMWPGSEYCEGLRVNRDEGVRSGMRGMLTCPNHEGLPQYTNGVEPWMAEELRLTVEAFRRRDGGGG